MLDDTDEANNNNDASNVNTSAANANNDLDTANVGAGAKAGAPTASLGAEGGVVGLGVPTQGSNNDGRASPRLSEAETATGSAATATDVALEQDA